MERRVVVVKADYSFFITIKEIKMVKIRKILRDAIDKY